MANNKNIKINLDYSDFVGGISECQSKMQLLTNQFKMQEAQLGNNASKNDELALAQDMLNQKIQLQEQIVAQSLEKWEAMANSEETTVSQVEAAHRAWQKQSTILAELNNDLERTREELEQVQNAENEIVESTESASDSFDGFISTMSNITSITNAISSVVGEINNMARESAGMADDIATMSTQFGVSTQTMTAWVSIAGLSDVSAQTLGDSMSKLTRQMSDAANGSSSAAEKFRSLGVSATDAHGNLRSTEEVFYEVIDALSQMDNASERDAAAMGLLGRSAQQLNPIIEMGANGFREMADSAINVIPPEFQSNLTKLADSFDTFDAAIMSGQNALMGALAPALSKVLDTISGLDPSLLGAVAAFRLVFNAVNSLAPILQLMTTQTIASTVATVADAGAKEVDAAVTNAATAAETGFAMAALEATMALAPQLLVLLAIAAACTALAAAIYLIVEALNEEADAADEATNKMGNLKNTTDTLTGMSSKGSGTGALALTTSHFATGSTVGGAGGLAWVGEQGPELVNLPYGSTVYNSEDSRQMNTSSVNNYYVTIDAKEVNDFNKVVKVFNGLGQSMNRGGRVNG